MNVNNQHIFQCLVEILVKQQGISILIEPDHRICYDLGVCDGDFQDFMMAAWEAYDLPRDGVIYIDIPESEITLANVAELISKARTL
jgi:hypothetical protein